MINIRKNTFETSSSSVHTLVFCIDDLWDFNTCNKKTINEYWDHRPLIIKPKYFGRAPMPTLYKIEDKASYLWTAIIDFYCHYNFDTNKYYIDNRDKYNWWKEQILSWLPKESKLEFPDEQFLGGIDHSYGLKNLIDELEKTPGYIGCLLYDDSSFIEITGDEYPNFTYAFLPYIQEQLVDMPGRYSFYVKGN